jgi:hypothetical protein
MGVDGDAGVNLGEKPAESAPNRPVQQPFVGVAAGFFHRS